jgi:sulfur-oxidizing protein SoxB
MGKRIVSVEIGDRPLDVNAVYGVMACERDGDPLDVVCRMTKVANVKRTDYTLQQIMREYIGANSPLTPTPPRNCVALDTTQELLTQVTGVDYQFH